MPVGQGPSSGSTLESLLYSDIRTENAGYDPSGVEEHWRGNTSWGREPVLVGGKNI